MNQVDASPEQKFTARPCAAAAILDRTVLRHPAGPAIDFLGRVWTWREIGALTDRATAGLQKLGVTKGTRVGLCLPNTPYSVILYFAILKAGGTVVNFNPLYTAREIADQVRDSGTTIMVSLDITMIQEKIAALVAEGMLQRVIVCSLAAALPAVKSMSFRLLKRRQRAKIPRGAPYLRFERLIAMDGKPAPVSIDPEQDIAVLQYTGGTTGVPKGAKLSHANITSNVQQIIASSPVLAEGAERIVGILPFFHVFAMTVVMNLGVAIGAELVLMPRIDVAMLMRMILRKRPTILPGVPTLFTAISNVAGEGRDLSFVKFCVSGGAPISNETANRFERLSKCEILEGYGLTEASGVVTTSPPGAVRRGSVGIAAPGTTIEIRDPEHPEIVLPRGERGEICIRGPQVMKGYLNRPDETANVFVDGALRTGDIGYLDSDGYLFVVDRMKDLILCSGFNVYPRTIEEAAYQHEAVQDAVAIGIPDAYRGQAPKLFVTLRPAKQANEAEILQFLQARLNRIEIPKVVEIRTTLPKTMVGKLSKKELIAEAEAAAKAAKNDGIVSVSSAASPPA